MTEETGGDQPLGADETVAFARHFARLAESVHALARTGDDSLRAAVEAHLGIDPGELSTITEQLEPSDRPNLQLAIDALVGDDAELLGISPEIAHYGQGVSIALLLSGRFRGPTDAVPPTYEEHPVDVGRNLRCVTAGLWLFRHDGEPVVLGVLPGERHGPPGSGRIFVEVMAADEQRSEAVLEDLRRLRAELNVYRGKALAFTFSEYGEFGINFVELPTVPRAGLILPEPDLAAIDRHAIGIGERAAELRAAGRHLKRGLLLYGPPGTGKTHTVSYLATAMPDRTIVILQGPSVGALGQAVAIARAFPPAMIVIEDVDLIAHARGMPGMETNPLLFQLLNEMDGLSDDVDLLFVLTTNRVDMLEPALAARPGRIDAAVEITRPGTAARLRLLELYLAGTHHVVAELEPIVGRLEGVSAAFVKELCRRAVLSAIEVGADAIDGAMLDAAVTELLDQSGPVVRSMLGAGGDAGP